MSCALTSVTRFVSQNRIQALRRIERGCWGFLIFYFFYLFLLRRYQQNKRYHSWHLHELGNAWRRMQVGQIYCSAVTVMGEDEMVGVC